MKVNIINLFKALKARIGMRPDSSKIPSGPYCYELKEDVENPWYSIRKKQGMILVKYYYCPYQTSIFGKSACLYTGFIGDDMVFDDSCKICNENCDYRDE